MALSLNYETRHGITASYWRIESIEILPVVKKISITLCGHLNWEQAGGANEDPDRTRPNEPSEPLIRVRISASGALYDKYVRNHSSENQAAAAYSLVKEIGTPDGADLSDTSQIDFSNAADA